MTTNQITIEQIDVGDEGLYACEYEQSGVRKVRLEGCILIYGELYAHMCNTDMLAY